MSSPRPSLQAGPPPPFADGSLQQLLEKLQLPAPVQRIPLDGSFVEKLEFPGGQALVLKSSRVPGQLEGEALGLDHLRRLAIAASKRNPQFGILLPQVLGGFRQGGASFLVTSFLDLEVRRTDAAAWQEAGRALAELSSLSELWLPGDQGWGYSYDTWLGGTLQANRPMPADSWPQFFARNRLAYLADSLSQGLSGESKLLFSQILEHIDELLPQKPPAALLHGDLWPGNFSCLRPVADKSQIGQSSLGCLAMWDPAVSFGHGLSDLAMASMFGGVPQPFYAAYAEALCLDLEAVETRVQLELYRLYHWLNHRLLFGTSYAGSVTASLRNVCQLAGV